jgi:hypothetical protein
MKEIIEKLIGRLEEEKSKGHYDSNSVIGEKNCWNKAIEIVNQLAEEYNNGWISVEDALPELTEGNECFKQSPCCYVTLKWWDGDITESVGWYNQSGVWNDDSERCKVIAWKPIAPYKPKGE